MYRVHAQELTEQLGYQKIRELQCSKVSLCAGHIDSYSLRTEADQVLCLPSAAQHPERG